MLMVTQDKIVTAGKTMSYHCSGLSGLAGKQRILRFFNLTLLEVLHSLATRRQSNAQEQILVTETVYCVCMYVLFPTG